MSKGSFSRRDFLKAAGTAGVGSLLAAGGAFAQVPGEASGESAQTGAAGSQVPKRRFGKTGVDVSCLALGGMFDTPSNQLLLRQALKWGVTYWDTADCYSGGNSEKGIGQFFKKYPEARKEIFLVTKSDARDPAGITKLLNQSLDKLSTDYIDLYFLHGISNIKEMSGDVKAWAEKAKAGGKIKYFGFSAHSNMEELMLASAKMGWVDGLMVTYNFRIMNTDRMKAAVDACTKAGIGITAMKTQGGGPVSMESETELEMAGKFLKQGFTDKQAKLKAIWTNPAIASVCSQMPSMTVLMSNVAAALNQTKLSASDMELLERYALETASGYCAGCAQICESAVAGSVPIRDVMRCLMYHDDYGDREWAREVFARLDAQARGRLTSIDYSLAEEKCPQKLEIGKLMQQAASMLA